MFIGTAGLCVAVSPKEALAADEASCRATASLAGVYTGDVPAVINACSLCFSQPAAGSRGTLWMSNQGAGQALVLADRNVGGRDNTATFSMYGQVYSCTHGAAQGPLHAYNIRLQDGNGNLIPEIPSIGDVNRGSTSGTYQWSEGGSTSGHKITNLDSFFNNSESSCRDLGNGAQECTRNVNVYRCFSPNSGCYPDPSTVRAVINDTTGSNKNHFYSKSMVEIPAQGADISGYSATSNPDGSAQVEISTDERSVNVNFKHALYYDVINPFGASDTVQAPSTGWKIRTRTGTNSDWDSTDWRDKSGATGTWTSPSGKESRDSGMTIGNETVTVTFNENESGMTKKVCRRVRYEKKYIDFIVNGIAGAGYNWVVESGSGYNSSQACAYITYISPGDDDPLAKAEVGLGASAGSAYTMLAGEDASLSINGEAEGVLTRRLIGQEAVVFNHGANTAYDANLVAGATRFKGANLCDLFWTRSPKPLACSRLTHYSVDYADQAESGSTGDASIVTTATVAVPDDIGQKYCNSFGYKFRYFYGIRENGAATTSWTSEPTKDYTFVAKPACRTIAKKPTAAFWNGSVLVANDSIVMSLAKRHLIANGGPKLGDMTPSGSSQLEDAAGNPVANDERRLYGSWSEYLVASLSGMEKNTAMASGSTISNGTGVGSIASDLICNSTTEPWTTNSPMTISNVGCNLVGVEKNISSGAFRTRLTAYLEKASGGSLTDKTQIIGTSDQNYTIDHDIVNDGTYSIRTVPQTIIFAKNVNITSNVTRIDAWIIAKGTVNTCKEYEEGTTGGTGTTSDGVGSDGSACAKQLVFNGPVVASNMQFNRTFGADSQARRNQGTATNGTLGWSTRESSAEIFNLRADAYLWSYTQAARYGSSYNEVYTRELAPRY